MNYLIWVLALGCGAVAVHSLGLIIATSFGLARWRSNWWMVYHFAMFAVFGAAFVWLMEVVL